MRSERGRTRVDDAHSTRRGAGVDDRSFPARRIPRPSIRAEPTTMTPNVKLTVTDRNGRKCASTGSPWEPVVGYSRAVRAGDFIFVTGTVGLEPDGRFGPTARQQTRRAMEIIVAAI